MNLYNNDESEFDIPDFVEEKDEETTENTDEDVDLSIFKMSEEELYDDVDDETEEQEPRRRHKKSSSTIILCLVLAGILLITSVVSIIYAFKEHNKVNGLNAEITQLKQQNTDLQTSVNSLNTTIDDLNKKIEEINNSGASTDPDKKYPSGTVLYITEDGQGMGIKAKASIDSDFVDSSILDWGDKVTLVGDAVKDADGNYWGKIDKGFIRIEYNGEIWASTEQQ